MKFFWLALLLSLFHLPCWAADSGGQGAEHFNWPGWRGPERTGVSKEIGLLQEWPEGGPKLLWQSYEAGLGWSGFSVFEDRLYTLGSEGKKEFLHAFDAATGKKLWTTEVGRAYRDGFGVGPRSTPVTDGEFVYALGGMQGNLVCLRADTGKKVWVKNYHKDFQSASLPKYGRCCESPLLDGDRLVCTPGGETAAMFALDKKTGEVIWQTEKIDADPAYSSITVAEIDGVRQYIQHTATTVFGVAPEDGQVLWRHAREGFPIATPIVSGNLVFLNNYFSPASNQTFKVTRKDNGEFQCEQSHKGDEVVSWMGGVLVDGYVYGALNSGNWGCVEPATGKVLATTADEELELTDGTTLFADGRFYCYETSGQGMFLMEAGPKVCKQRGRIIVAKADVGKRAGHGSGAYTPPALSNGRLFVRDQKMILCYDVKAPDSAAPNASDTGAVEAESFETYVSYPAVPVAKDESKEARVDYYGDPLPEHAVARIGTLRFQPDATTSGPTSGFVSEAALTMFGVRPGEAVLLPGRSEVASVHRGDSVYIWDAVTGRELRRIPGPPKGSRISITDDGKRMAVAGARDVWAYDLSTDPPEVVWKNTAKSEANGFVDLFPPAVLFSPDGKLLVVTEVPANGEPAISLLDAQTGKEVRKLAQGNFSDGKLAFSPDSRHLAALEKSFATPEPKLRVWNLKDETEREILDVGNCFFAFTPDCKQLLLVGHTPQEKNQFNPAADKPTGDAFVGSWEVASGTLTRQPVTDLTPGAYYAFLPDGKTFLELGRGRIRYLDAATGKERQPSIAVLDSSSASFRRLTSDSKWGLSVNPAVRIQDLKTGEFVGPGAETPRGPVQLAFSADGKQLATADRQLIQLWETETGKPCGRMETAQPGEIPTPLLPQYSYVIPNYPNTPAYKYHFPPFPTVVSKLAYPADERLYTFVSKDGKVNLRGWNAKTGKPVDPPVKPLCVEVPPYEFSRSGRLLAVVGDCEVTVYDLVAGKELCMLSDLDPIGMLAFSPDEKFLLCYTIALEIEEESIPSDRIVRVWELSSGEKVGELANFMIHTDGVATPLALGPEGKRFASTGGLRPGSKVEEHAPHTAPDIDLIRIWDSASGKAELEITGPAEGIHCMTFSPDGSTLVTGGRDGKIRFWDLTTGKETRCLEGHRGQICSLLFSPDGKRLASGSADATAVIWDMN